MIVVLFFLVGVMTHQTTWAASISSNSTQVTTSSSTSSIVIAFDLPTAAVVTFVLVLLGLAAGLLLIQRFSYPDRVAMG